MSNEGLPAETKPRKRRTVAANKKSNGRKTLAAAFVAAVLAAVDLYLTFRIGIKWPF